MTGKKALVFLDALVVGAVLGYLLVPYVKKAACALVAAGEAARIDEEWLQLNMEENRGGLS